MDEFKVKIKEYYPYLEDLARRIRFLTICFLTTFIIGFFASTPILKYLVNIFNFKDVIIATTSPFQLFNLAMDIAFFISSIICIPIFIYQIYAFIENALNRKEKKVFLFTLPLSILLFIVGFAYGFLILFYAMQMLANVNTGLGIKNLWDISLFLSNIMYTSALLGILFQLPIILTILIKFRVLDLNFLKDKRKHAILGIFIFTSLLPPTDGISLILMALPLIAIYEITIIYNRLFNKLITNNKIICLE